MITILSNMLDFIADLIRTSEDLIALKFFDLILDCSNLCVHLAFLNKRNVR